MITKYRFCFLIVLFLLISTSCSAVSINPLNRNGHFIKLKGHMGNLVPVYWSENEVFFPGGMAYVYKKNTSKIVPAQIYNVDKQKFTSLGAYMNEPRMSYTAIRLENGNVLILGGIGQEKRGKHIGYAQMGKVAEIYDKKTNTFRRISDSNFENGSYNNFITLKDGRIFLINNHYTEIFDPKTEKFTVAGNKTTVHRVKEPFIRAYSEKTKKYEFVDKPRKWSYDKYTLNDYTGSTLTLLDDGRILIIGSGTYDVNANNAEIYDPKTNTSEQLGKMNMPFQQRSCTKLPNGNVLIVGGRDVHGYRLEMCQKKLEPLIYENSYRREYRKCLKILNNVEIFDIKTKKFILAGEVNPGRSGHFSTLLSNGKVLIFGGGPGEGDDIFNLRLPDLYPLVYNPKTGKFSKVGKPQSGDTKGYVNMGNNRIFITGNDKAYLFVY